MADAFVKQLNQWGYLPVFLPQTNLVPPDLYNFKDSDHKLVRRGPLQDYLPGGTSLPEEVGDLPDQLKHTETSSKSLSGAISFLQNGLACLGVTGIPRIDLSFTKSRTFEFLLGGLTYRRVPASKLDLVIRGLRTDAIPAAYVSGGHLHVAYEYAYARTLTLRWTTGGGTSGDIGGDVSQLVELGGKAKAEWTSETSISFERPDGQPVAFAYRAGRLELEPGGWVFFPDEFKAAGALQSMGEEQPLYLVARGVVLEVETD